MPISQKDEEGDGGSQRQRGKRKQAKAPRAARLETEYNYGTCVFNLNLKSNSQTSESSLASGNQIAGIILLLTSDSFLVGYESGISLEAQLRGFEGRATDRRAISASNIGFAAELMCLIFM